MSIDVGRVEMVPVEKIILGERAREVMGDLDGVEFSMRESGLISPLAFRYFPNSDKYLLLAGERRYTVLSRNSVPLIPGRIYDHDLTELEMKMIEKAENFHRKDMEYYELDCLTLEIHKMQQSLHGVKAPGPSGDGWGIANTGDMLGGVTKAAVSQSIKRAEARETFPELFGNCRTASDASKILKKVNEVMIKDIIAQKLESNTSNTTLHELSKCYSVKSFFDGVKKIPDGIMHLVEIDPPYAIDLRNAKKSDGESQYILNDYNEIPAEHYINGEPDGLWQGMNKVFQECYRVMSNHSWLLCWFAPEPWFNDIYHAIINAGFQTTRMCPIWTKITGQSKRPEMHLPNSYEMFFYAWKGRPAIARSRSNNIFNYPSIPPQQKTHPTERPLDLMVDIYETFAFPGSRILIPFVGSGVGIFAAHKLGMAPVGFDLAKSNKDSFLVKANAMSS